MKKRLVLTTAAILSLGLLASCGGKKAEETTAAEAKDTGDLKTVSIQIDGSAVPYYAPLYLAQENGYFAEEGLNVEFYYAAAADIVKNVAEGNVEFGFTKASCTNASRLKLFIQPIRKASARSSSEAIPESAHRLT